MYKRPNEFVRVDSSPDRYDRKIRLVYKDGSGFDEDGNSCWRLGMIETDPSRYHAYDHIEFESEGLQLFNYSIFSKITELQKIEISEKIIFRFTKHLFIKYFIQKKIHLH